MDGPIDAMINAQIHRGPDGQGRWTGCVAGHWVALGHTRLAILDLSEAGAQPMQSACGRHLLVYNGEIYNYRELRAQLEALNRSFRSESDTEVVLQALMEWGPRAFSKFNGMWAIAWLQLDSQKLLLCRDRLGIKPLYVHQTSDGLIFSSEIKAILSGAKGQFRVNSQAVSRHLDQSLLHSHVETFFEGINPIPTAHWVEIDLAQPTAPLRPHRYWSVPTQSSFSGTVAECVQQVKELFTDSVRLRLRSDVPVGVLLSGGLDSSAIAATMQRLLGPGADLHVLSAVSDDPRYSEEPSIDLMSAHLHCPVHKVHLRYSPDEAFGQLAAATYVNDAPIGSFSSIALHALMERAKSLGITVVLSGQGADELLCGYRKYLAFYARELMRNGSYFEAIRQIGPFVKPGSILAQFSFQDAKRYLPQTYDVSRIDIRGPVLRARPQSFAEVGLGSQTVIERQSADLTSLSVPALVHYEDRMSMANSREIRLPFLDYRLVELLAPLPIDLKLRDGWTKWVFRKAMEGDLPAGTVWRKDKRGFSNPQSEWLKNEYRDYVLGMMRKPMLVSEAGFVDQPALLRRYEQYCRQPSGKGPIGFWEVFNPLALEVWMRMFRNHLAIN